MSNIPSIRTILPVLFLSTLSLNVISAQTEMRWEMHGVGFTVPSDFKVSENNAEEYTASNDNLFLTIVPIQDEELSEENLAEAVLAMAKEMEYDALDEVDEIEIHDFTGYYIRGRKDGANAVVMALLDKLSSTNLLVVIVYADGHFEDAVDLAKSFVAFD